MNEANQLNYNLVPYPIIASATVGDVDAINAILNHFGGYITTLSTRQLKDEVGNSIICVDEEMRRKLETKLITKMLSFTVA